jgi:transglutaminase-like putative cysteine protease
VTAARGDGGASGPRAVSVRRAPARTRIARAAQRPEDSVPLRLVVLAVTELSVIAVAVAGAVDVATMAASLVLVPVGSLVAFRRRREKNVVLKLFLAAGLILALFGFIARARTATSVDDARVMLGSLFVWVQVLHSFDLPRRRDLSFSMAASVVLMAEAGSISLDAGFGLLLLPFCGLAGAWLFLSDRESGRAAAAPAVIRRRAADRRRPARAAPVRSLAGAALAAAVASTVVFMFTPHVPGARVLAPPFSLASKVAIPAFHGGVVNPDFPSGTGGGSGSDVVRGNGYPGFGANVDLRVRGRLSDRLVMRVRSPQPAYWRGQAYDTFNGTTWTAAHHEVTQFGHGTNQAIELFPSVGPVPTRTVLQTFFVVRRQPNIVFAAANPRLVYFPAGRVAVDRYGSIRAPIILEPDTVYSVVSEIPDVSVDRLRLAPPPQPSRELAEYTQLPEDLPDRVVALAHRITDGLPTTYDKVMAVQRWLQRNTKYNLDIPPDPPGVDAVDEFLFVRRQGFCEHIASAMAILLRAVGVPTRFAVGFDTGDHNLLTGYYEVHESDAHAWVEVYYPGVGWQEYDPTQAVPSASGGFGASFLIGELFGKLGRLLARIVPAPVKHAAAAVGRAVASAARSVARAWPVAVVVVVGVGTWLLSRRRRRRRAAMPTGAAAAFESMCRTFDRRGHPRAPERTPRRYAEELVATDPVARSARAEIDRIVTAFERERFAARPPDPAEVAGAEEAATRVCELASTLRSGA